jgi:hypothetical protein
MMRISLFFLEPSWRRTMKTMHPGKRSSPPRRKKPIPSQPKKIQ